MQIGIITAVIIAAAAAIVAGVICFILGGQHRKKVAEKAIGDATEEAKRIVSNALTTADTSERRDWEL